MTLKRLFGEHSYISIMRDKNYQARNMGQSPTPTYFFLFVCFGLLFYDHVYQFCFLNTVPDVDSEYYCYFFYFLVEH